MLTGPNRTWVDVAIDVFGTIIVYAVGLVIVATFPVTCMVLIIIKWLRGGYA